MYLTFYKLIFHVRLVISQSLARGSNSISHKSVLECPRNLNEWYFRFTLGTLESILEYLEYGNRENNAKAPEYSLIFPLFRLYKIHSLSRLDLEKPPPKNTIFPGNPEIIAAFENPLKTKIILKAHPSVQCPKCSRAYKIVIYHLRDISFTIKPVWIIDPQH